MFRDGHSNHTFVYHETFTYEKGIGEGTIYTYLFKQNIMFRHSCENCHFCNITRPSDLTIADFWGWERTDDRINKDNKGISLVLLNTEKGRKLFENIRYSLNIIPAKLEDCLQPNLQFPSIINPKRTAFEKDYKKYGFEYVINHYGNIGWRFKLKSLINLYKRMLRFTIKYIYGKR